MTEVSNLQQRTSDFSHVYYMATEPEDGDYSNPDIEFPVIEGSINYGMGEVDYEYVKLVSGAIWATKRSKGDPDISFQVATNNKEVAKYFGNVAEQDLTIKTHGHTEGRAAVAVDTSSVKCLTGTLIFTDDAGNAEILPGCELTASRGKEGVAYWNVKVVPGNTIIMTQ